MTLALVRAALACALACFAVPAAAQQMSVGTGKKPSTYTAVSVIDPITGVATTPAPAYGASGVPPVTASLTAPGNTSALPAVAGRPINVSITGTASGLSARLTRSFDGGATWLPLTVAGQPYAVWTGNISEQAWVETEAGVQFRVEVAALAAGTATIRISQ
ncbi:hypothetical protein [Caulobacter sp. UNC279MFTsu5.1]|uniref:hypothetical protein n=1 Tax=Caulobacter sp. UNC279MFTsu5.1 TaxID=1502775 RepID=UPI0008F21C6D|nr:hypothetical protein [Caulobacter sp. UNC279MFTsu5.1]SFK41354.1 hypothetical protein SAMN02799626_04224 [Caulobacter sp. UNC279MFTsu5.1]